MKTVIATFATKDQAERAIHAVRDQGYTEDEISIVAREKAGQGGEGGQETAENSPATGASWGTALGGVAGIMAGAGALAIPGIGPIIAAGPLAAALSGAVTGGIAGGLLDLGIPEERGRHFEEQVRQGKFLAVVEADEGDEDKIAGILQDNGADNLEVH